MARSVCMSRKLRRSRRLELWMGQFWRPNGVQMRSAMLLHREMANYTFSPQTSTFCTKVLSTMKIWLLQKAKMLLRSRETFPKHASHGEVIAPYSKSTIALMVVSSASHVTLTKVWKWWRDLLVQMTIQCSLWQRNQSTTFKGRYASCLVEAWLQGSKRGHSLKNPINFQMKSHFGRRMD